MSATVAVSGSAKEKKAPAKPGVEAKKFEEDQLSTRRQIEKLLKEDRPIAAIFVAASLLILLALFLGLAIDLIFFARFLSGRTIDIRTQQPGVAMWGMVDVARVVILFLFFGYMIVLIESLLAKTFPIIKNDNLRMVVNSSILDALTIVFILYFAVRQYGGKLISLGLTCRNFFVNVFYGIVGYLAALPLLFLLLVLTSVITNMIRYVPKEQVVVELFLHEKNPAFLIYTSLFAAIAGPIVEELFFRGFMYGAVKKHIGIWWAAVITALLFAALHAHAVGFLPIMVLGLVLAYLYEKTGTLVAPITVHITHNFSMVLLVFLAKSVKGM